MKRYFVLLAMLFSGVMLTSPARAQLSGMKTIDPAGSGSDNFTSFKQAIDTLNTYGVGNGGVTFTIASGTYTEAGTLAINPAANKPTAGSGITFAVKSGATVVLNLATTAGQYGFTVGSAANPVDYVTLDGANATGRGWTIHSVGPDGSNGILVFGDYCKIQNLVYAPAAPVSNTTSIGILLHETGSSDYCVVENCDVASTYGIMIGSAGGTLQTGNRIEGNTVRCISRGIYATQSPDVIIRNNTVIGSATVYPSVTGYGIYASNASTTTGNVVIEGNTVRDLGTNAGTTAAVTITGIYAGSKGATYTIARNRVYNISNATTHATTNVQVQGITTANGDAATRVYIVNNFIYGLEDNDPDGHSNWTAGIRTNTGGKMYVYNNTVFVKHTTRNHANAAFICGGGAATDTNFVYNNIFYVDQTGPSSSYKSYCVYKGGSHPGVLQSDYNVLVNYGGGANSAIGQPNGTTFTAWQGTGRDVHSVSKPVVFADSVNDLHLSGASVGDVDLTGVPASWVANDIDGALRHAKYPYMGADEASTPLAALTLSASAVDFGTVVAGDSLVKSVSLKSATKNTITITSVSAPTSDFSWSFATPVVVADSVQLTITFKPHAAGVYAASVSVVSDGGTSTIALTGTSPRSVMSGAYTIDRSKPTGGANFNTFAEACAAVTANGVSAPVTFTIASGTYDEPAPLAVNPKSDKPASGKEVTFAAANGATVVLNITTPANQYAFTVGSGVDSNSVDYVTLNGSNGAGRGWTINSVGPDSSQGVIIFGDHCQLKNLTVSLSSPWSAAPANGVVLHQTLSSDYCVVENCDVTANYGIVIGTSTGSTQTGNRIEGNTVHCLTRGIMANQSSDITINNNTVIGHSTIYPLTTTYGIYASNSVTTTGSVVIDHNTVRDFGTNTGTTAAVTITGITGGSKGASYAITRNRIYNFYNATSHATTNVQVQGITLSNGDPVSVFDVSNNFVYGLEDNDADASGNWTAGIRPITAGKVYVYFNTVFVKHTARNHYTAAFICGGGIDAKDTNFVYDNIFYVDQTGASSSYKSYCIYKGGSHLGTLVSDYNVLTNYGGGANSVIGSPSGSTFATWQKTGRDLHSVSKSVAFADSVSDLHLTGASVGDADLTAIPAPWVSNDFDNDTRNEKYPYMGADEASIRLAGGAVSAASVKFDATTVGDSLVTTVYIKSLTKNPITVTSVSTPASDFRWTYAVPSIIADSSALAITFKPHASGSFSDTAVIATDFGTMKIALSGMGKKAASDYFADDFTSSAGTALTAAGWQQSGTSATNPLTVTANGLSFGSYAGSGVGNSLAIAPTGQDVYASFGLMNSGSVYLTFMANVSAVGTGDYFIALSPSTAQTNYYARLHVKASGSGYVVGISKSNEVSGGAQYGSTVFPLHTTNLIVVKYTFTAADTVNDPISVYVFPTRVPATEPSTAEIAGYTAASKTDAPDLGYVTLRQGTTGAAPTMVIDGIRIGTTWAVSVPTGVQTLSTDVPRVFSLGQNYPNPFNPSTTISFTVENDAHTTLRVFNILGQPVATVFSGVAQAGRMYRAAFDASRLPSGVYFARLESGSRVSIRKMMLMK